MLRHSGPGQDGVGGMSSIQQFAVAAEAGPRALVVDDDVLAADALTSNLRSCGYQARFLMPVTAASLRDALGWAPDLAVLDTDRLGGQHVADLVTMLHNRKVSVVLTATDPATVLELAGTTVVEKAALLAGTKSARRALTPKHRQAALAASEPTRHWTTEVA